MPAAVPVTQALLLDPSLGPEPRPLCSSTPSPPHTSNPAVPSLEPLLGRRHLRSSHGHRVLHPRWSRVEQRSSARRSFAGAGVCSFPGGRRPPSPGAVPPPRRSALRPSPSRPPARASPARAAAQRPDPPPPPSSAATTIITSPAAPLTLTLPTAAQPPSASPPLAESAVAPPPMWAGLRTGEAFHW